MRLFIAVRLDDDMRDGLVSVQSHLRAQGLRGKETRADSLHLTLAFIGEWSDPGQVLDAMGSVSFQPFPIRLEGLGSFGDLYWAGIRDSEALSTCVRRLRRSLAEHGIPFDRKRFLPHITLVRRAVMDKGLLSGVVVPDARMEVDSISLMRSDRGKNGMVYTEIGRVSADT